MFKKPAFYILLALILFLTSFDTPSAASPQQQKVRDELKQEAAVIYKLVQIYVTDKKGNPVTDLTAADFELTDNGQTKQITHFEKHRLDIPPAADLQPQPELAVEPLPPPKEIPSIRRKFFFVFNFAYINPAGIQKARQMALYFLNSQVHPADEIGIISFSASKGVTIHEYLTTDHKRIRNMIESLGTKYYVGRAEQLVMQGGNVLMYIDKFEEDSRKMDDPKMMWSLEEAKARLSNYLQNTLFFIGAMRNLIRGLRIIPGTKNLIVFSSGISGAQMYGSPSVNLPENLNSVESLVEYSNALEVKYGSQGLREAYQKMIDDLKAANCPIFSVNIASVESHNEVDQVGPGMGGDSNLLQRQRDISGSDSLREISSKTGGQYFNNTMDLKVAAQQIQKTTSAYYVLGYSIPESWDGKFHKIKIKVKRTGCEVLGEAGYYNPKPFAEYSEFEKFIQILDLAAGEVPHLQEGIVFSVTALPLPQKDKPAVSLFSKLPTEKLKSLPPGKTEVVTMIFNSKNNLISVFKRNPLFISALNENSVFLDQAVGLPPGRYDCRVIIRNLETGRGSAASTTVVIPEKASSPGITLYPAHLFKPGTKASYQGDVGSLSSMYPFDMSRSMPVIKELERQAVTLQAVVPCVLADIAEPEISLTGSLVNITTKQSLPLEIKIQDSYRSEAVHMTLAEIALPELESGAWSLLITAEEKKSGTKSQSATNFMVR